MYKHILIATDGSDLSRRAVSSGIELASAVGAEITLINVVARYPASYFEGGMSVPLDDIARAEAQWTAAAQAVVDAATQLAVAEGLQAKGVTVSSNLVADSIIATAQKHHCDLIVMASHGHRGIKRLLLGSETLQVLTHSQIPVLVLR